MRLNSWLANLCRNLVRSETRNRAGRVRGRSTVSAIVESLELRRMLSGSTITVDEPGDTHVAGHITLRDAITTADNLAGGGDTIVFAGNVTNKITLTQGELPITNAMTITGPGANVLTISGNNNSRIFDVTASLSKAVTINKLTLSTGNSANSSSNMGLGGAVYNSGTLTLSNDTISGNTSSSGGGLFNIGTVTSTDNTYSGNSSGDGGGIYNIGTMNSINDTIFGNTSASGGGGAFFNSLNLTTVNDTITNNFGSGIFNQDFWVPLNTIMTGNFQATGSNSVSDVFNSGGSVQASFTLIGTENASSGITNGTNGNIVGKPANTVFVTSSGVPLLSNNGGQTQTIALLAKGPAVGHGGPVATSTNSIAQTSVATTISIDSATFVSVGELLRIDHEIVLVTAVNAAQNQITIQRAQNGTTAASHLAGAHFVLAYDATGSARVNNDLGALAEVNHAPTGTSGTVTTLVNKSYPLKVADFGYMDPNDSPPNSLLAIKFPTLPTAGTLTDNGVALTAGQFVSLADISGGKLVFKPNLNLTGGPYFLCKFQVEDDGGGANLDPNPKVLDVKITPINHAPSGTPKTVTTLEDTAYLFKVADFGFTDPNDSPPNALLAVKITTLPLLGTLTDNGVAVTAGKIVLATDITGNQFKYTPATNGNGAAYASFTFQVEDNGGTANGGINTDPTPRKMTVAVTSVNDAPVGTSGTVTTRQSTPYSFKTSDFGFTDPNDTPPNTLLAVKFTTLPTLGVLSDNGIDVTAGQLVSASDINNGLLIFKPNQNLIGGPYFVCKFQVEDNGGTANGGMNLDPTPKVLDIRITA